MSPPKEDIPVDERMRRLERRANVIRSRMLRAVDVLDARRNNLVEMGERAKEVAKPAVRSLLAMAMLLGVSVLAFGLALRARRRHSLYGRASEAIQRRYFVPRSTLLRRVFEKATLSVMSFAVTELAKRLTTTVVEGREHHARL